MEKLHLFYLGEINYQGADIAITTVFKEDIIKEFFLITRKQCTVFIFGSAIQNPDLLINSDKIHYDQINIMGSSAYKPLKSIANQKI